MVTESIKGWCFLDESTGNNCDAKEDRAADDETTIGARAVATGPPYIFDPPYTADPSADLDVSITNLFYGNNFCHDFYYDLGFDEAAGNFQVENFYRGGIGGDPVYADAQDGSGTNNASFMTLADGTKVYPGHGRETTIGHERKNNPFISG